MIRELVCDDAVLSTPCAPATAEDAELAQDLIDTMNSHEDAVCLAANQVGVARAVVVYKGDDERDYVLYNPKMLMGLGPQKLVESCMTHEGESRVTRFIKIKVAYDELVGSTARRTASCARCATPPRQRRRFLPSTAPTR